MAQQKQQEQKQTENEKAKTSVSLPKALTLDWAQKTFPEGAGAEFYHWAARFFGFGDFRYETFAGGAPALDLSGLSPKQIEQMQAKADSLVAG
jgi:hypothetical protein